MSAQAVTGFSELEKALKDLSARAGKGVLSRSLKKAAFPIAEVANNLAPEGETGQYKKSFVYSTRLTKRQARLHRKMFRDDRAAVEGFVGTSDPAGIQQEFGNIFHKAQPALRPAWDREGQATLDRLGKILWENFKKAKSRAAKG
jgi:hypothetical protein